MTVKDKFEAMQDAIADYVDSEIASRGATITVGKDTLTIKGEVTLGLAELALLLEPLTSKYAVEHVCGTRKRPT